MMLFHVSVRSHVSAVLLFVMSLALAACASTVASPTGAAGSAQDAAPPRTQLLVFAAASLAEAFGEIGGRFQAQTDLEVVFNFAGSQQLAQQLAQGAPADVFASASEQEMNQVVAAGLVAEGAEQVFARNRLVVIVAEGNPGQVDKLEDLGRPGVKLVLAAEQVPAGRYAKLALDRMPFGTSWRAQVDQNIVSQEQNVRGVVSKVSLGEADVGIVYVSDTASPQAERLRTIAIPDELNQIAAYPLARTSSPPAGAEAAQLFVDFVLGDEGQQILARYDFLPAQE